MGIKSILSKLDAFQNLEEASQMRKLLQVYEFNKLSDYVETLMKLYDRESEQLNLLYQIKSDTDILLLSNNEFNDDYE